MMGRLCFGVGVVVFFGVGVPLIVGLVDRVCRSVRDVVSVPLILAIPFPVCWCAQ